MFPLGDKKVEASFYNNSIGTIASHATRTVTHFAVAQTVEVAIVVLLKVVYVSLQTIQEFDNLATLLLMVMTV